MTPDFFNQISRYASVSVVGMAKNVGKTVCLRALLDYHRHYGMASKLAVTSIGVDGETTDVVYQSAKPELNFYPGMLVQTAEQHYGRRHLTADILDLSNETTACGRLVTARVLTPGKLIISGYSYTQGLKQYIRQVHALGAKTAIIDGALSRLSLASPFVSEAMVLCTGAALSKNLNELVQKTRLQYELMHLPVFSSPVSLENVACAMDDTMDGLSELPSGVYGISPEGEVLDLGVPSLLQISQHMDKLEPYCRKGASLYVTGLLSDPFLKVLTQRNQRPDIIVSDFTKLFISSAVYRSFVRSGSRIMVLQQPEILGVCVNPFSPDGYLLNSVELRDKMSQALGREVYDILA